MKAPVIYLGGSSRESQQRRRRVRTRRWPAHQGSVIKPCMWERDPLVEPGGQWGPGAQSNLLRSGEARGRGGDSLAPLA